MTIESYIKMRHRTPVGLPWFQRGLPPQSNVFVMLRLQRRDKNVAVKQQASRWWYIYKCAHTHTHAFRNGRCAVRA